MLILGYPNWQKAEDVIARAARACINSGQAVGNHFNRLVKNGGYWLKHSKKARDLK